MRSILRVLWFLLLASCLQPIMEERLPEYFPPPQDIQSTYFSCDNSDLLIVTVFGGTLQANLNLENFVLIRDDKVVPLTMPVRSDDACALFAFDQPLTNGNDYRFVIKGDAVLPGEFGVTVSVQPVSSGQPEILANTIFGNSSVHSACYADGRFIAAGDDAKMAFLTDSGTSWVPVDGGPDGNLFDGTIYGVAGGNGRYYAAGAGPRISFLPNGTKWFRPTYRKHDDSALYFVENLFAAGTDIRCVTWGSGASASGGRFAAAGENGRVVFELDPDTWFDSDITLGDFTINTLTWGAPSFDGGTGRYGRFIAAGSRGNLFYSTDADGRPRTWVAADNADSDNIFNNFDIYCSAYGAPIGNSGGIFVAGGQGGRIAWSPDGEHWSRADDGAFEGSDVLSIAFGSGVFIAAGDNGKMAQSSDGIYWEAVTDNGFNSDDRISAVASNGRGRFIAAGNGGDDNRSVIVSWYQKPSIFSINNFDE